MDNTPTLKIDHSQIQMLAKNLRKLIDSRGVSESEIAQSLNIPVLTVRRIVSGETTDPRISTLKLIADYFNVSIDSLIGSKDNNPLNIMTKNIPQFVPILDWKTAGKINSLKDIDLTTWNEWYPIALGDNLSLSEGAFALESRPSMQPRFLKGTLLIIDPSVSPTDGDIVLVKMKADSDLSLRELIIDPPKWRLQPVVTGSEMLFYNETQHQIVGIVVLCLLHTRKEK